MACKTQFVLVKLCEAWQVLDVLDVLDVLACACMSGMSLTGMSLNLQSTNDTNGNCCTEPHLAPGLEECRSKLQKKHSCKGSDKTC